MTFLAKEFDQLRGLGFGERCCQRAFLAGRLGALCALAWGAVTLLALALGHEVLHRRFFSNDESFTWRMCQYTVPEILERLPEDGHPPLHYLIWKAWASWWGDSILSLRCLALLFSLASVLLLWQLSREGSPNGVVFTGSRIFADQNRSGVFPSLFVALMATISQGQVFASSNGRMYSLGVFLALLSAWSLWRALKSSSAFSPWWSAYALITAAFCYTHYFAFFAVLGQVAFVAGGFLVTWLWAQKGTGRALIGLTGGFIYAMVLAGILFWPWVPTFISQTRAVEEGWWVPAVTATSVEQVGFQWLTGVEAPDIAAARLWMSFLLVLIAWTLWHGGPAAWFFFLQAFVPWVCVRRQLVLPFSDN